MKTNEEMIKEIKEFQNAKVGYNLYDDEEIVEWCVKLVHEIFIQKKHTYIPDLDR